MAVFIDAFQYHAGKQRYVGKSDSKLRPIPPAPAAAGSDASCRLPGKCLHSLSAFLQSCGVSIDFIGIFMSSFRYVFL